MAPPRRQRIHLARARYYSYMNEKYTIGGKARDWIRDAYESWTDSWDGLEPANLDIPSFRVGDLLSAGGGVAVVTGLNHGPYGWRYDVLRSGQMWRVDEHALLEWRVVSKVK